MGETKIEWADKVWNPVTGCTKISIGCQNCYAERMAKRLAANHTIAHPERYKDFKVSLHPERLFQPLYWKKSCRVFVCSMGDLFHEDVPDYFRHDMFDIMSYRKATTQHTFLILTKRPDNMKRFLLGWGEAPNVWLGVSVSNQEEADKKIPILLQIPAAVRFVSVEPMLGPVTNDYAGVDWYICGAETGPNAREMYPWWPRHLRNSCQEVGVPFFFKKDSSGNHTLDGQLWEQFPQQIKESEK